MKVVHVITGLRGAGAQYVLYRLLERLDPRYQSEVISLYNYGVIGDMVRDLGVPVTPMNMGHGIFGARDVVRLSHMLRERKPDVVHTWMHLSNLIGGVAARMAGIRSILWAIHGDLDVRYTRWSARMAGHACVPLAGFVPRHIVCVSHVARENHIHQGYPADRTTVIPNGFDTQRFRPNADARRRIREECRIDQSTPVVGMLARFREKKRHEDFIKVAKAVHAQRPKTRFLMSGGDVDPGNAQIAGWIKEAGLEDAIALLGERKDMPDLLNALDVLVSPSIGEGFPLVVGEAMSAGVPCVGTNVGDTAYLIGDGGITTEPYDIAGMAGSVLRILSSTEESRAFSQKARSRIMDNFDLDGITRQYELVYDDVFRSARRDARTM